MILITADGGGSNGRRLRLRKIELLKFSDAGGFSLSICHFPQAPVNGIKMDTVYFPLFRPIGVESRCANETVVNLIAKPTTAKG
jgi:hypothetical protein